jgi:hypothetical protein
MNRPVMRVCPITNRAVHYELSLEQVDITEHGLEVHQWPCTACWPDGIQWHATFRVLDEHDGELL